jgi:hypothetical protein
MRTFQNYLHPNILLIVFVLAGFAVQNDVLAQDEKPGSRVDELLKELSGADSKAKKPEAAQQSTKSKNKIDKIVESLKNETESDQEPNSAESRINDLIEQLKRKNEKKKPDASDGSDQSPSSKSSVSNSPLSDSDSKLNSKSEFSKDKDFEDDILGELEKKLERIEKVDRTERTNEQRKYLELFRARKQIADTIQGQLSKTKLTKTKQNRGLAKSTEDSFVVARIHVSPRSKTAEITFASVMSEGLGTSELYHYLKHTPAGGFRDYRILGRFAKSEQANVALTQARAAYDAQKENEAQMIAYIKERNRQLERDYRRRKARLRAFASQSGSLTGGLSTGGGSITGGGSVSVTRRC